MDDQNQLRVGLVGCGDQGEAIARAIARTSVLCLTACADPDEQAAAQVAAIAQGVAQYRSVEELIDKAQVDAIAVATSHDALSTVSLSAIRAGKHVLAEKPIAVRAEQAAEIEAAVAKAGICYMAGYSFRHLPSQKLVFDLLQAGTIGEIQTVTGGIGLSPLLSGWIARPETGGGPLLFVGSHLVDAILWYLGDRPVEVYANVRYRADTGADETATFQIRFAGGAIAQCMVTQAAKRFFNFLHLYGREGNVGFTSLSAAQAEVSVWSSKNSAYAQPTTVVPRIWSDAPTLMMVPELEEFAKAIIENRQPSITAADGRRVLQVLDAVIESGRTGRPVALET